MNIILGGTGQVGSGTARTLLNLGKSVTVVTRDKSHGKELKHLGARVVAVDIRDATALREVFRSGNRAFLLSPPADPSSDTDAEERANVTAIMEALDGSRLEKVVAQSTYGARPGKRCGDLTVLHEFEQRLKAQPIPTAINRGAYYMSNWAGMIDVVRETGRLPSFFPADLSLPMISPDDLGRVAARRLTEPADDTGTIHIEGPKRYTPKDVAKTFSDALGCPVEVQEMLRGELKQTFLQFGFSEEAAASYACMTEAVIDGDTDATDEPLRCNTTLREYIRSIIGQVAK